MLKETKHSFSPPAIGAVSLLVIFVVLCLTVFALLSLSTVYADARLADASTAAVENYYRADCEAQEILARMRAGEVPDGVTMENNTAYYCVAVTDTQEISVTVRIGDNGYYEILEWKLRQTDEWVPDDSLDLWTDEDELNLWTGAG